MLLLMSVLTVNGHKEFGLQKRVNKLKLLLTGVSRNVHVGKRAVNDHRAHAVKIVYDLCYVLFVSRNRRRADDNGVVGAYAYRVEIVA